MNLNIKNLISTKSNVDKNITSLEEAISTYIVFDEKSKVNFGNLTIALKGYRLVSEAIDCLLLNEGLVKGDDGNFYKKVDAEDETPTPKPGSDFDVDIERQETPEE